jgi:hypothetical protein
MFVCDVVVVVVASERVGCDEEMAAICASNSDCSPEQPQSTQQLLVSQSASDIS